VDLEKFQAVKRIPYEVFTIAFVGQLIPEKGVLILLRAINELTADSPTVFHVLIAGQGSQESELRDYCRANRMNHVQFLGQIDWVDRLYRCVDIVVVPSQWDEACAFSIIEAMACGACIVASNAGGNPELIGPDGTAGVLFHKSNVTELKQKLRELLCNRDRRIAIGTAALERANKMFSLKRMVGEYVRLYEELDALKNY
jgi:glycosyltransferase involved in cell wall biosynthesis